MLATTDDSCCMLNDSVLQILLRSRLRQEQRAVEISHRHQAWTLALAELVLETLCKNSIKRLLSPH